MISETLKKTTRPAHDKIENSVDLVTATKDEITYPEVLKAFYAYYLPVEAKLYTFHDQFTEVGINLDDRLKSGMIAFDLETLGIRSGELEGVQLCQELPDIPDFYSAMGCLYVLEGSTLGGQVICRNIKSSDTFFRAYGDQTMLMWNSFKNILNNMPAEQEQTLVKAARETFTTLNKWLASFNFTPSTKQ